MAYDPTKAKGQTASDIDPSALGMPFLSIIQKGSPEFDEAHPKHHLKRIPDCKPGHIIFAPEKRILPAPVQIIPVGHQSIYTEWRPRSQGGGFVGYRPETVVLDKAYRKGIPLKPNAEFLGENELIFTIYFMLLFKNGNEWTKGVLAFTGVQLKHARNLLRLVKSTRYEKMPEVDPPLFAAVYLLSTRPDSNSKGSWMAWDVRFDRMLDLEKDETLLLKAESASVDAVRSMTTLLTGGDQKTLTEGADNPY